MLHIIQNDPEVPPGNITENLDMLAAACGGSLASKRWEELGTLAVDEQQESGHAFCSGMSVKG